jgi:hypothetical protein
MARSQNQELVNYIRASAIARGIDPEVALRVARSEGGLNDPFRHAEGPRPRSQLKSLGDRENAHGPFQLYISGTGAGLGDRAIAAGVDPRKDWRAGVDFALDEVARKGWSQWYGAAKAGIGNFQGVKGAKPVGKYGTTITSAPIAGGIGSYTAATAPGVLDTGTAGTAVAGTDGGTATTDGTTGTPATTEAPKTFSEKMVAGLGDLEGLFKPQQAAAGGGSDLNTIIPSNPAPPIDPTVMANAQALMQTLLAGSGRRKPRGLSLTGMG